MMTGMKRLPRFERRPADIPNFNLTARDEAIIQLVARHRFIRSREILALIEATFPGSGERVYRRLQLLFHAGYLARPKVQQESYRAGAGSSPIVYIVGNRGADLLAEKFGWRRAAVDWTAKARTAGRGEIEHALEVSDVMTAAELACHRHGAIDLIHFDEILATLAPEETRADPRPYHWPVTVPTDRDEATLYVIPDKTFGLRNRDREDGRNRKFFFLEADRGTMPVVRRNLMQSSLLRKLIAYGHTFKGRHHHRVYGLPNFRVLIVVPGRERIRSLIVAYKQHVREIAPPTLFLFADRAGLTRAANLLEYPWTDAAEQRHRLLD